MQEFRTDCNLKIQMPDLTRSPFELLWRLPQQPLRMTIDVPLHSEVLRSLHYRTRPASFLTVAITESACCVGNCDYFCNQM